MARRSQIKTLTIDGKEVGAHEDESILQIARENGVHIPTLCQIDGLSISGACRMCLVEVEGWNKLVPACATVADEGMVIKTQSETLQGYRRMIIEMLFAEGNHICAVCVANGNCELQDMAVEQGMDHVRLPYINASHELDLSHELFGLDQNRCISCTRCVRVCDEVEGAHTWDQKGRGINVRLITDLDTPWGESTTCTSCSKCVNVCPTGALFEKGKAVGEAEKNTDFLTYLGRMRGAQ